MQQLIARVLFFISLIGITLASLLPSNAFPNVDVVGIDKVVHVGMYFVLSLLFFFAFLFRSRVGKKQMIVMLIVLPTLYGGVMELLQMFVLGRSASYLDAIANFLGTILAVIVIAIIKRRLR